MRIYRRRNKTSSEIEVANEVVLSDDAVVIIASLREGGVTRQRDGRSLFMLIYDLSIFLTSTEFVSINTKIRHTSLRGIPYFVKLSFTLNR